MTRTLSIAIAAAALLFTALPRAQEGGSGTYRVDPARSRFLINVDKSGLFSFVAGHAHEVETRTVDGVVQYDPGALTASSVHLRIEAASLRVTGRGEPPDDVPEVQRVMLSDRVLDVERYPTIEFASTAVAPRGGDNAKELEVTGDLTLHGVTKSIVVPVSLAVAGDTLTVTGEASLKQSDYGMTPISVAGVVKVKDEVQLSFTVVASAGGR